MKCFTVSVEDLPKDDKPSHLSSHHPLPTSRLRPQARTSARGVTRHRPLTGWSSSYHHAEVISNPYASRWLNKPTVTRIGAPLRHSGARVRCHRSIAHAERRPTKYRTFRSCPRDDADAASWTRGGFAGRRKFFRSQKFEYRATADRCGFRYHARVSCLSTLK